MGSVAASAYVRAGGESVMVETLFPVVNAGLGSAYGTRPLSAFHPLLSSISAHPRGISISTYLPNFACKALHPQGDPEVNWNLAH